jgi:hypothetical protein
LDSHQTEDAEVYQGKTKDLQEIISPLMTKLHEAAGGPASEGTEPAGGMPGGMPGGMNMEEMMKNMGGQEGMADMMKNMGGDTDPVSSGETQASVEEVD